MTTLTTQHSASSHGIPVALIGGEAYGPGDRIPQDDPVLACVFSPSRLVGDIVREERKQLRDWLAKAASFLGEEDACNG